MKLNWKREGVLLIPLRSLVVPHAHAVNRAANAFLPASADIPEKHPDCAHELKLKPGVNDGIHPESWEEAKKIAIVQHYTASGDLCVVEEDCA